jgi:hypothetical protein
MVDQSKIGRRCRTVRLVRTVEGDLPKHSAGIMRCEIDNLDRHLIFVHWEQGFTVPVFPQEIEPCVEADVRREDESVIRATTSSPSV